VIEYWSYDIIKLFHDAHYTGIVEEANLKELKSFKLKIGVGADGKAQHETIEGWLVLINKLKYILPQYIDEVDLRDVLPIKIKKTTQFVNFSNIYHKPTADGLVKFNIPPECGMSFKDWIDTFAPFEHTNPIHWLIYKLIILGALCTRFNFRIATQPGFGKDSLPTILSELIPLAVSIYTPKSAPRLMSMLERALLVVNEQPDVAKDDMEALEPVIRVAGDMRTKVQNSALAVSGFTKDEYDISQLSMGFLYNEIKDYMPPNIKTDKTQKYFDNYFTPATNQRFVPFHLSGEIDVSQFKKLDKAVVYENCMPKLKSWVKMAKWLMDGGFDNLLKSKDYVWHNERFIGTKTGRLNYHFCAVLDVCKVYASSEQEYNSLADEVYKCYGNYMKMLSDNDDMNVEEIKKGKLMNYT